MAMMKRMDGEDHPVNHFLMIGDPEKPDTWHLPVMNMEGKPDMKRMGTAWAVLHGDKYDGPDKEEAVRKLKRMYQQMGKMPPGEGSKSLFYRAGNDLWFLGIYSNNFEDVEGETFSEKSHAEYVTWLKDTGVKPPITVLHQPKYKDAVHILHYMALVYKQITPEQYTENLQKLYKPYAIAETKTVFETNGFTFVLGKVYDNKRKVVENLMNRSWGMSHGFIVLDSADDVIHKYRSFEFTVLPEDVAANKVTAIGLVTKENMDMALKGISQEDRKLLEDLLQGSADDVETATQKAKDILSAVLGSKEVDEVTEEVEKEEEEKETVSYDQIRTKIFADLQVEQMAASFKELAQRIEALTEKLNTVEKNVKVLKQSDDVKVAAQFEQFNWMGLVGTGAKETTQTDQEIINELKEKLPVDEKEAAQDNPLQVGFWNMWTK